jgi:hypothetical protein
MHGSGAAPELGVQMLGVQMPGVQIPGVQILGVQMLGVQITEYRLKGSLGLFAHLKATREDGGKSEEPHRSVQGSLSTPRKIGAATLVQMFIQNKSMSHKVSISFLFKSRSIWTTTGLQQNLIKAEGYNKMMSTLSILRDYQDLVNRDESVRDLLGHRG